MSESPVKQFARLVRETHEVEYGDFKRKVGNYLNRLEEDVGPQAAPELRRWIQEVRVAVLFDNSSSDVEMMKRKTLELARKIDGSPRP
jgi:hypothetical protein